MTGIEPVSYPWEGHILPLYDTREPISWIQLGRDFDSKQNHLKVSLHLLRVFRD